MNSLMHLLQFTDSAFPVGTFSFSNGLETAAHMGIVHDADTLEQYARSVSLQAAYSDGVASLMAHRAASTKDYDSIVKIDHEIMLFKMNDEARLMLKRMGKKLAELGTKLFPDDDLFRRWLEDIDAGKTPDRIPWHKGSPSPWRGLMRNRSTQAISME